MHINSPTVSHVNTAMIVYFLVIWEILAQAAQLCSKPVEYSSCTTEAHNQMAKCSSDVSGSPTGAYYRCLCNGKNALVTCFTICSDDLSLQLQRPTAQRDAELACKLASEQESKDPVAKSATLKASTATRSSLIPTETTSLPSQLITTAIVSASTQKSPPAATATPKPKDQGGIVYSSGSRAHHSSLFILLTEFLFLGP